jgi:chromosomal replication initiator protein
MVMENHELWQTVLAKIELTLSRPNFLTWFRDTDILRMDDKTVTVSVPNAFAREWLQNKHHKAILHALRENNPEIKEVVYVLGQSATSSLGTKGVPARRKFASPSSPAQGDDQSLRDLALNPETGLNPRYTFANFVVGSFNELAHAAARSIVKNPGGSYNPFFVYCGVGLGKTHLIQAVGRQSALYLKREIHGGDRGRPAQPVHERPKRKIPLH